MKLFSSKKERAEKIQREIEEKLQQGFDVPDESIRKTLAFQMSHKRYNVDDATALAMARTAMIATVDSAAMTLAANADLKILIAQSHSQMNARTSLLGSHVLELQRNQKPTMAASALGLLANTGLGRFLGLPQTVEAPPAIPFDPVPPSSEDQHGVPTLAAYDVAVMTAVFTTGARKEAHDLTVTVTNVSGSAISFATQKNLFTLTYNNNAGDALPYSVAPFLICEQDAANSGGNSAPGYVTAVKNNSTSLASAVIAGIDGNGTLADGATTKIRIRILP